jgi:hypothetical protein
VCAKLTQANAVTHWIVCNLARPRILDASKQAQEASEENTEWNFHPADRIPSNSRGGVNDRIGAEATRVLSLAAQWNKVID